MTTNSARRKCSTALLAETNVGSSNWRWTPGLRDQQDCGRLKEGSPTVSQRLAREAAKCCKRRDWLLKRRAEHERIAPEAAFAWAFHAPAQHGTTVEAATMIRGIFGTQWLGALRMFRAEVRLKGRRPCAASVASEPTRCRLRPVFVRVNGVSPRVGLPLQVDPGSRNQLAHQLIAKVQAHLLPPTDNPSLAAPVALTPQLDIEVCCLHLSGAGGSIRG